MVTPGSEFQKNLCYIVLCMVCHLLVILGVDAREASNNSKATKNHSSMQFNMSVKHFSESLSVTNNELKANKSLLLSWHLSDKIPNGIAVTMAAWQALVLLCFFLFMSFHT